MAAVGASGRAGGARGCGVGAEPIGTGGCVGWMGGAWAAARAADSAMARLNSVSCCAGVVGAALAAGALGVDVAGAEGLDELDTGLDGDPILGADGALGALGALGIPGKPGMPGAVPAAGGASTGGGAVGAGVSGVSGCRPGVGRSTSLGAGGASDLGVDGPGLSGCTGVTGASAPFSGGMTPGVSATGGGCTGAEGNSPAGPKSSVTPSIGACLRGPKVAISVWTSDSGSSPTGGAFPEMPSPAVETTSIFSRLTMAMTCRIAASLSSSSRSSLARMF